MNIDIRANAFCTDGMAGRCTRVVVNPATLQVTQLVVQEFQGTVEERLVPLAQVIGTDAEGIRLNCTLQQLSLMSEFVEHTFIQKQVLNYPDYTMAWLTGDQIPAETLTVEVTEEQIPPNQVVIDSDTRVEATDGKVGEVDQLEVEQQSGRITLLVMREGHLLGEKGVAIPAAEIESAESKVIYLKLDKKSIEALPVVLVGM